MTADRVLVTKEIAARLGCSERTVGRLFRSGGLPGAFKVGKQGSPVKISEADLRRFILTKSQGDA